MKTFNVVDLFTADDAASNVFGVDYTCLNDASRARVCVDILEVKRELMDSDNFVFCDDAARTLRDRIGGISQLPGYSNLLSTHDLTVVQRVEFLGRD